MPDFSTYKNLKLPKTSEKYNIQVFNENNIIIDSELNKLEVKNQSQDDQLNSEIARATTKENEIIQKENEIVKNLSDEITRAKSVENELSNDINNEVNRATTAEISINDNLSLLISELTTRLNALADSDDTTLDQLSEIVAYIKNNKTIIDGITTSKVSVSNIVDCLTSTATDKPLSANQGRILREKIETALSEIPDLDLNNYTKVETIESTNLIPIGTESGTKVVTYQTLLDSLPSSDSGDSVTPSDGMVIKNIGTGLNLSESGTLSAVSRLAWSGWTHKITSNLGDAVSSPSGIKTYYISLSDIQPMTDNYGSMTMIYIQVVQSQGTISDGLYAISHFKNAPSNNGGQLMLTLLPIATNLTKGTTVTLDTANKRIIITGYTYWGITLRII